MNNITTIENFELDKNVTAEQDREVREIFNAARRRLVEVKLRNNAVLSKHKAQEPITVLCLAGAGVFRAGKNLEDSVNLRAGTLITLEPEIEHEVIAEPELYILVTKFKKE